MPPASDAQACPMCGAPEQIGPVCTRCSADLDAHRASPTPAGFRAVTWVLILVVAGLVALGGVLFWKLFDRRTEGAQAAALLYVQTNTRIRTLLGDGVRVEPAAAPKTLRNGDTVEVELRGARLRGRAVLVMQRQDDVWWVSRGTLKIGEKSFELSVPPPP